MDKGEMVVISGPVGAGKSTVAREFVDHSRVPTIWIEGDNFWRFLDRGAHLFGRRKNFELLMRSLVAAAIPWAGGGYRVVVDFSIPPTFLETLKKMLHGRDIDVHFVILKPSVETCAERAAEREEGVIKDYSSYAEFYEVFDSAELQFIDNSEKAPPETARELEILVESGRARVGM